MECRWNVGGMVIAIFVERESDKIQAIFIISLSLISVDCGKLVCYNRDIESRGSRLIGRDKGLPLGKSGAENKIEARKRLTVGEQMLADSDVIARATEVATQRIEAMDEATLPKDFENAVRYAVTLLEKFVARSPSQLGIKPWLIGEYAIELVVLKRVLEHLTAKSKG